DHGMIHVIHDGSQCLEVPAASHVYYLTHDSLVSDSDLGVTEFQPALQREDGSYIGVDTSGGPTATNVVAVSSNGATIWQTQLTSGEVTLTPLYATADGGAIVRSTPSSGAATLYNLDQYGNTIDSVSDTGAKLSWSGQWYQDPASTLYALYLPQ